MSQFPVEREAIQPRRLELELDPEDGSLLTAPLLSVLMAATDGLYSDLYNMAHGEMHVTSAHVAGPDDEQQHQGLEEQPAAPDTAQPDQMAKMSNLSFAQRRHELAWRLASHGKTLTHVSALAAAAASTDLAHVTNVSTKALQHARTAWRQADEAQDALYFFHAQLFPARQAPSDVYGALDTLLANSWPDMPQDLYLTVDRYDQSKEKAWTVGEVADRWHMAVRDKLLRGEMGWMKQNSVTVPWKISLRGGIVRLTYGKPKRTTTTTTIADDGTNGKTTTTKVSKVTYPIEAVLTVLSTSQPAEWTLVSVEVHAQAKTGQSNHQLDTTNRQRFDLHRLCALAMSREEARARLHNESVDTTADNKNGSTTNTTTTTPLITARPLHSLFQMADIFGSSWQLEVLSAQAQALRKDVWGGSSSSSHHSSIVVTPVQFFENRTILGIVSISFWTVDDRYGPPCMGDLHLDDGNHNGNKHSSSDSVSTVSRSINTPSVSNQLSLSVRAEPNVGIRVSLTGAESIMEFASVQPHIRSNIQQLLEATSNPFCLSASEALMAATRLCAERKCYAMVQALSSSSLLPSWISLAVERGSIAVAAKLQYHGIPNSDKEPVVLFRLTCDARTGSFVSTFSRSTQLLQFMACNDLKASSESTALRIASLAKHRRSRGAAASSASGRAVRDAFDGLSRSMNVLGQRTGVGGSWKDTDSMSASLRQRAILMACKDVRVSLMTCCGMATVYGLAAIAIGVATGVAAIPDM